MAEANSWKAGWNSTIIAASRRVLNEVVIVEHQARLAGQVVTLNPGLKPQRGGRHNCDAQYHNISPIMLMEQVANAEETRNSAVTAAGSGRIRSNIVPPAPMNATSRLQPG
jgi:hypothetical protein